jgi:transposase
MLTLAPSVRVFALKTPVRWTLGIDGLVRLVRDGATEDPFSGNIFCFFSRHRDRVRLLVWDRNGFWVMSKRLERGRFERVVGGSHWV